MRETELRALVRALASAYRRDTGRDLPPDLAAQVALAARAAGRPKGAQPQTVKKGLLHRHGLDRDAVIKELGDVMWYVAALATLMDVSLSEIMGLNIEKLLQRYPDGYSTKDSVKRVDVYRPSRDYSERDE